MLKTCKKCGEEFDLKPGKPGYANVCEDCTGLHPNTPLAKPAEKKPRKSSGDIGTAALNLLRAVEALEGRPDSTLREIIRPLLNFRVPRKKKL